MEDCKNKYNFDLFFYWLATSLTVGKNANTNIPEACLPDGDGVHVAHMTMRTLRVADAMEEMEARTCFNCTEPGKILRNCPKPRLNADEKLIEHYDPA